MTNLKISWQEESTKIKFKWIPGGEFLMGSPEGEIGRSLDESPLHKVFIDGFWMSKYLVTNKQYRLFVNLHQSGKSERLLSFDANTKKLITIKPKKKTKILNDLDIDNHPVMNVNWNDSKAFAKWLEHQHNGKFIFRLPTEAEWEYACRAGNQSARFWGDEVTNACNYANIYDLTKHQTFEPTWDYHNCRTNFTVTSPVGSFLPNDFGLYDMIGNVWEWCEDVYNSEAYHYHQYKNPIYTGKGDRRVRRGGGWLSCPMGARSAARRSFYPDFREYPIGFRLIMKGDV